MKKITIISTIITLLIISGFGFYYFLNNRGKNQFDFIKDTVFFPIGELIPKENTSSLLINENQTTNNLINNEIIADISLIKHRAEKILITTNQKDGSVLIIDAAGKTVEVKLPTLSAVHQSLVARVDNNFYIIRRALDNFSVIRNSLASFNLTGEEIWIDGGINRLLSDDIWSISVSPDQDRFFILEKLNDGVVGYTIRPDLTGKTQVWQSPLIGWQADWPVRNFISLYPKPTKYLPGFLYRLNLTNGEIEKVLSNIPALAAKWSPDGKKLIYSGLSSNDSLRLNLYDYTSKLSVRLPLVTLVEKCAWADNSERVFCAVPTISHPDWPDSWYQGEFSSKDVFWRIDVAGPTVKLLSNPADLGLAIDASQLIYDDSTKNLYFLDKKTGVIKSIILPDE